MAFGFPFRVTAWRRNLSSSLFSFGRFMLTIPAIFGSLILLFIIPETLEVLSFESSPPNDLALLGFETECDHMIASVIMQPSGASQINDVIPEDFAQLDFRKMASAYSDHSYEPFVQILLTPKDAEAPACKELSVMVGSSIPTEMTLLDVRGASAVLEDSHPEGKADRYSVEFNELAETVALYFGWPTLYQYSHHKSGLLDQILGERVAAIRFYLTWGRPDDTLPPPQFDLILRVTSPNSFDATYSWETPKSQDIHGVHYQRFNEEFVDEFGVDMPNVFESWVFFHASGYRAKENFMLLSSGALIGLGITLIVETLIALLFRLERRSLTKSRKDSPAGIENADQPSES